MNPADAKPLYDYSMSMLDDGPSEEIGGKALRWMATVRRYEPAFGFFYGSYRKPEAVSNHQDLGAARAWLRSKQRSSAGPGEDEVLLWAGVGKPAPRAALHVHPVIHSKSQWLFTMRTPLVARLTGGAPGRAAELFRELVSVVRPWSADWAEFRNFALICCGFYEKRLEGLLPPWLPRSYPEEAVPYMSLASLRELSFRYPVCVWWHNYWCREIVDEIGRSVVLTTPAAQVVEAPDGGVFIHLCNEPFTIDRPDHLLAQRRAVEHLNLRALQVKHANPLYYGKFGTGGTK